MDGPYRLGFRGCAGTFWVLVMRKMDVEPSGSFAKDKRGCQLDRNIRFLLKTIVVVCNAAKSVVVFWYRTYAVE